MARGLPILGIRNDAPFDELRHLVFPKQLADASAQRFNRRFAFVVSACAATRITLGSQGMGARTSIEYSHRTTVKRFKTLIEQH